MKRFLFINPFGIGDCLFTTPAVRAVKEAYPDSFLGYWCNERVQAIFKNDPNINEVFALSRGDLKKIYDLSRWQGIKSSWSLFNSLKKARFDAALDYSLDHRYGLTAKLAGIRQRIGFSYKNRGRFLTEKIDIEGYENKHVVEFYLDLLQFLNIKPKTKNLYLNVAENDKLRAKAVLKRFDIKEEDLLIGIAAGAGASWGKDARLKHWPALKFAQLADRIISEFKAKILVLGDESERPLADIIVNAMRHKAVDLVGKTTLEGFIALVDKLNILITNDGGPLHIAVALGLKTVSIFGPVDERVYGPYPPSDKHIVIKHDLDCRPCYEKFRMPFCGKNQECINSTTVDEVFDAVRRLV